MTMPEHVIEQIFGNSDLADQKSLSMTCHDMSAIFGRRKVLAGTWLNLKNENGSIKRTLTESNRKYTKLICKTALSTSMLGHLSKDLTHLKVRSLMGDFTVLDLDRFISDALALLENLTYLDLIVCDKLLREVSQQSRTTFEPVLMKKLAYLKTTYMFLELYHDFIDFGTENLNKIVLRRSTNHPSNEVRSEVGLIEAKHLIAQQNKLKVLHMSIPNDDNHVFDRKFAINSKLKELMIYGLKNLTPEQEENFYAFVMGQNELEYLSIIFGTIEDNSELSENFRQWKLNQKVKSMEINFISKSHFSERSDLNLFDADEIRLDDEPNVAVQELHLRFYYKFTAKRDNARDLFSRIMTKFPNVARIHICAHRNSDFSLIDSLGNIRELTYQIKNHRSTFLKSNTIPNLEFFKMICDNQGELKSSLKNLINFISKHKTIKWIEIEYFTDSYPFYNKKKEAKLIECVIEIVGAALKHLDDIKMISVSPYEGWRKGKTYFDDEEHTHDEICTLISEYAHANFIYRSPCLEVLKRSDGQIVRKCNGMWTAIAK